MCVPGVTVKMVEESRSAADAQRWFKDGKEVLSVSWTTMNGRPEVEFELRANGVSQRLAVRLDRVQLAMGERTYFRCPRAGERCSMLFVDGLELLSAPALGIKNGRKTIDTGVPPARLLLDRLTGRDGRGPARGDKRQALLAALPLARSHADPQDAQVIARLTGIPATYAVASVRTWPEEQRYSTQAGLAGWAEYVSGIQPRDCLRRLDNAVKAVVADHDAIPLPILPSDTTDETRFINDCPSLDIRALVKQGHLVASELTGFALHWLPPQCEEIGLTAAADLRNQRRRFIVVCVSQDGADHMQVIWLRQDGRGRMAFLCPINGSTQEILYWRYGRFASRAAQGLAYASQRQPQRHDAAD